MFQYRVLVFVAVLDTWLRPPAVTVSMMLIVMPMAVRMNQLRMGMCMTMPVKPETHGTRPAQGERGQPRTCRPLTQQDHAPQESKDGACGK